MIEQITLEIIENDLISMMPEKKDNLKRYFRLLNELMVNNDIIRIVNSEQEFDEINIRNRELFDDIYNLISIQGGEIKNGK